MKKNTWITLAFLTTWTACKKNTSSSDSSSRLTLIAQASWKFDTSGVSLYKDGTVNIGDTTVQLCFKDKTFQFNKDSTGIMNNGALKCNSTDPQTVAFTWSFSNKGDSVLQSNVDPILANGINIFSLTTAKLVLYKDTTVYGQNIWYVISFKH
jgi:hypothetical protein